MNYPIISSNTLLGKLLRLPLKCIPSKAMVPIIHGKLKGKKWVVGSGIHGYWLGIYESKKANLFANEIVKGNVVFDIGANVGYYTLLSSILVKNTGKVIAFEPLPRNVFYLNKHLKINQIKNVEVIQAAVSDKCGSTNFAEGPNSCMGRMSPYGQIKTKSVSLDCLHLKGEIFKPDLIKIDVEGAEFLVLSGAKELLATAKPKIFLAIHGNQIRQQCINFLKDFGYNLFSIDGKKINQSLEIMAKYI